MKKIKIVGILIILLSILLILIAQYIDNQNKLKSDILETINQQQAYTQEISKNIFYMYRDKDKYDFTVQIEKAKNNFLTNLTNKQNILNQVSSCEIKMQSDKIIMMWGEFNYDIEAFTEQIKVIIPYSNVLLENTVKRIYLKNLSMIMQFDKLKLVYQKYYDEILTKYKTIKYSLFIILSLLFIYFFTQIKVIITFIQKFSNSSKKVIENSSIMTIQPITINNNNNIDIENATNNFNFLVKKINQSIQHSYDSMKHTSESLNQIEDNIEEFLILLNEMDEKGEIDIEMTKKEDAIIQSLDQLMKVTSKLDNLYLDLENLIKLKNQN
ncbi:MAG: hypothetical protein KAJ49_10030 [Arcobacteraceae bacterium]|nr:hypothetical protein [Arcobacteraceae bacterium]